MKILPSFVKLLNDEEVDMELLRSELSELNFEAHNKLQAILYSLDQPEIYNYLETD